jgi:hypothetical protein
VDIPDQSVKDAVQQLATEEANATFKAAAKANVALKFGGAGEEPYQPPSSGRGRRRNRRGRGGGGDGSGDGHRGGGGGGAQAGTSGGGQSTA